MQDQLHRMEARQIRIETMLLSMRSAKTKKQDVSAARRAQYAKERAARNQGKVCLPDHCVLRRRDSRLASKTREWALAGIRFGTADDPEGFMRWFCFQWNNAYTKKAITYSGGYFRVHTGLIRCSYGPFDMMGYNRKQTIKLRNDGELVDFQGRPWWRWSYHVLLPVFSEMQEMDGFAEVGERFLKCVRILLGSFGEHEVYTGLLWDINESMPNINRMFRRVAPDLRRMWASCIDGLRSKTSPPLP